jgi:hypothetical protein
VPVGTEFRPDPLAVLSPSRGYPEAMTTPGPNVEMVTIPLAELDAMKAELHEYRLAAGRAEALRRIRAFQGPETGGRLYTAEELAEAWGPS